MQSNVCSCAYMASDIQHVFADLIASRYRLSVDVMLILFSKHNLPTLFEMLLVFII